MPYYSRLKMQTDTQETKLQEKDSEVLRLLNQIATDMIVSGHFRPYCVPNIY